MTHIVQLLRYDAYCPIKAEIRAVDSQSDLRILRIVEGKLRCPLTFLCAFLQKKGKKGKGHGKAGKGKPTEDTTNNKQEGNDHEETEEGELGLDGHELDQMNVSDLDGSDDEQEQVLNTDKNTEELLDTRRDSNEMPGSNEHEESGEQIMQCDDEEPNRLESPGSNQGNI